MLTEISAGVRRGSEKLLRKNRNLTQVDVGKQIDLILKKGEFPDQEEYVQRFKEASKVSFRRSSR
jgi:hypothetical protein